MGAASRKRAATGLSNIDRKGITSRWISLSKTLSDSDRARAMRRVCPVIEIDMEALMRRKGNVGLLKSYGTSTDLNAQCHAPIPLVQVVSVTELGGGRRREKHERSPGKSN